MSNEKLTVWNSGGLEKLTRENFTERALNTPYHSPSYLECDFFDLTGHILLWEYVRTHLQSVDSIYNYMLLKEKGISFVDTGHYRRKVNNNACCFSCVYAWNKLKEDEKLMCKYCPLDWGCPQCFSPCSVYEKFKKSETVEEAREYALQIRDLPVKQGVIVR